MPTGNRGPLGSRTNTPGIDPGTSIRGLSRLPGVADPGATAGLVSFFPAPSDDVTDKDDFERKLKVGKEVYLELGLAGQIAEKFLSLPYRKGGKIKFKTGKLKGEGLVCTSFAKIFGALWFTGNELKQDKLGTAAARGYGLELKGSPAAIYADKYGGAQVNTRRLRLKTLVSRLSKAKLYAVVTFTTRLGATRQHIWFLAFSKSSKDWVRIESTGSLKAGGKGPGPGIYKFKYSKAAKKNFYQAWDWGALKPRDPDIDDWSYTN